MRITDLYKTVALFAILGASHAHAQSEIIVPEDGTLILQTGAQALKRLEIRRNGTLKFSGPSSVMVTTLVAAPGAKILYENASHRTDVILSIYAADASGVVDLTLDGDGKDGTGFNPGQHAAAGPAGGGARNCRLSDPDGSKASSGGPGAAGANGAAGEDAVDFSLYLPKLSPGAQIRMSSVGGNGGRGQDGGPGGRGGDRSNCHDGRNGGPGGAGGSGGKSGDAGKALVFIVLPDADYSNAEKQKAAIATTKVDFNIGRGIHGARGKGGGGGQPGRGALIGPGGKSAGADGPDGAEGQVGDGPLPSERGNIQPWARVEVISAQHYAQFVAQRVNDAFPR